MTSGTTEIPHFWILKTLGNYLLPTQLSLQKDIEVGIKNQIASLGQLQQPWRELQTSSTEDQE